MNDSQTAIGILAASDDLGLIGNGRLRDYLIDRIAAALGQARREGAEIGTREALKTAQVWVGEYPRAVAFFQKADPVFLAKRSLEQNR